MKRLLVVLTCALVLMANAVFAAEIENSSFPPRLNVKANLGWDFQFKTGSSGFKNSYSAELLLPLIGKQSYSTNPQDIYGLLEVKDLDLNISRSGDGSAVTSLGFDVVGKIVYKPFYLSIYNVPSVSFNKSQPSVGDTDGDVNAPTDAGFEFGTEFGIDSTTAPDLPYTFSVQLLSFGDSSKNTGNLYELGGSLNANLVPEFLDLQTSLLLRPITSPAWQGLNTYFGLALPLNFDILNGFTIRPATDISFVPNDAVPVKFDASATFLLNLSAPNLPEKQASSARLVVFYGEDHDISASVDVLEPMIGGWVDSLGFKLSASVRDVINSPELNWSGLANVNYQFRFDEYSRLEPSVTFTAEASPVLSDKLTLTGGIAFVNENAIPSTTFTISYTPGDFLSRWNASKKWDPGIFAVVATVAF